VGFGPTKSSLYPHPPNIANMLSVKSRAS